MFIYCMGMTSFEFSNCIWNNEANGKVRKVTRKLQVRHSAFVSKFHLISINATLHMRSNLNKMPKSIEFEKQCKHSLASSKQLAFLQIQGEDVSGHFVKPKARAIKC